LLSWDLQNKYCIDNSFYHFIDCVYEDATSALTPDPTFNPSSSSPTNAPTTRQSCFGEPIYYPDFPTKSCKVRDATSPTWLTTDDLYSSKLECCEKGIQYKIYYPNFPSKSCKVGDATLPMWLTTDDLYSSKLECCEKGIQYKDWIPLEDCLGSADDWVETNMIVWLPTKSPMLSPTASYAPSYQLSSNAHVQPE
jgi:hypothetical protein